MNLYSITPGISSISYSNI